MIRNKANFDLEDPELFRLKALQWAKNFAFQSYFNPNRYLYPFGTFQHVIFADHQSYFRSENKTVLSDFHEYTQKKGDWLTGYFSYDLKNEIEDLESNNRDLIEAPLICFYQPKHIILFNDDQVEIHSPDDPVHIHDQILSTTIEEKTNPSIALLMNMSQRTYIKKVETIKEHILDGDVYELNLCLEFYSQGIALNSLQLYNDLNTLSPMPFSCYQKLNNLHLICASPERFLKRSGNQLISQPIKGTIQRGDTTESDERQKQILRNSEKEQAENMMIVDLVRNDLARSSVIGTVKVEELFGIYSFNYLHQMISTVSSQQRPEESLIDVIKNAFPMGSMTGAPKIKAMQLIDKYEESQRGIFSGTTGYIYPNGDFDFNVIIRSLVYNQDNRNLSFHVGSAITHDSEPQIEFEECLLKAKAIKKALKASD